MSMRCLLSESIGCTVEMRPGKAYCRMVHEPPVSLGVLTEQWSLESKRVEGRVCLRDADITTKISFIGRMRLVKEVGSFLNKSVVFRWRFTGLQQNSALCRMVIMQEAGKGPRRPRRNGAPAPEVSAVNGASIRGCAEGSSGRRVRKSVGAPNRRSAHRRTGTADGRASTHRAFHCPAHP